MSGFACIFASRIEADQQLGFKVGRDILRTATNQVGQVYSAYQQELMR